MPLDFDGFRILGRIAAEREAFQDIAADVSKAAHALVRKRLKTGDAETIQAVRAILGEAAFGLVVDGMSDRDVAGLCRRFGGSGCDREWLAAIAGGERAEQRPPKARIRRKVLGVKSMAAVREK